MPNNALILTKDKNNVLSINGNIPWYCPENIEHFKETSNEFDYIIMGRSTYFSLPSPVVEFVTKYRKNVVLTSIPEKYTEYYNSACVKFMDMKQVVELLDSNAYCLVIGGAKTATSLMDYVDSVFLSTIKGFVSYNIRTIGEDVVYLPYNFKRGQYSSEEYHKRKNRFELELEVDYPTFKLEVYGRRGAYFDKGITRNDLDPSDTNVKNRSCLMCTTSFLSSWNGNRICSTCKNSWNFKSHQDLMEETYLPEEE